MKRVFVALSGGVDSSVAAALLKKAHLPAGLPALEDGQGFDVRGIHIKMWSDPDLPCTAKEDRLDAMRVAARLGIPFETWDFTDEYRREVVDYMVREYAAGRTPNPDVMCNRHIKFGAFLKKALERGADYVATGHYVRRGVSDQGIGDSNHDALTPNRYTLSPAHDASKDQSYFLWTLTQEQLKHCLFPIGGYTKPEVRELARKFGLPTAEKPDSQGVCFIGEFDMREFLKRHIPERKGAVLTAAGRTVGEHNGVEFFTIGERHGIGIGGGIPYYIAKKDLAANALIVSEGPYDENLFKKELTAKDVNWISGHEPKLPLTCQARIRYRQPLQLCRIERIRANRERMNANRELFVIRENSQDNSRTIRIIFNEPQRAITPGQSVVFYKNDEILGGGIIA